MRLAIVLTVALAGCGHQKVAVPVSDTKTIEVEERKLTDKDKIALLRKEAHERGMQWHIWCVYWNENDFQADAWRKGESTASDDNWELHDRWMKNGQTQAEAAYELYFAIQGEPTHPKKKERRRQTELTRKNTMCPPDLHGE